MSEMNCPNCGDRVSPAIKSIKMITCNSCATTLLLEDEGLRQAGEQGILHEVPMICKVGDTLRIGRGQYQILGHARFSYGRGTWDEFWALDKSREPVWISVDEGDLILQRPLPSASWPEYRGSLRLGRTLRYKNESFRVDEDGTGTCVGVKGSFGHPLKVGETYRFLNLQGENGTVLSAEIDGKDYEWFIGSWVDPFEVEVKTT
ncbi:DUF4178 domain-containing protein [Pseudophaeobacter sp.]|uniref:DUF4178 domain-containing protein n=1 Tax=Pseudophaeobacter sp. TaxID=1971739 RepID=UPI003296E0D5